MSIPTSNIQNYQKQKDPPPKKKNIGVSKNREYPPNHPF